MGCFSTPLTSLSPRLLQDLVLQSQSILKTLLEMGKWVYSPMDRLEREAERLHLYPEQSKPWGEGNLAPPGAHSTGWDYFWHRQTQRVGFSLVLPRCEGDGADNPDGAKV